MISLEFDAPRIQEFGGPANHPQHLRIFPNEKIFIEEDRLLKVFEVDKTIEHYRANGTLICRNADGSEWTPKGAKPAARGSDRVSTDIAPTPAPGADPKPVEAAEEPSKEPIKPTMLGGGVPGGSAKDSKEEVAKCDNAETLAGWLEHEKRSSVRKAIEERIAQLEE